VGSPFIQKDLDVMTADSSARQGNANAPATGSAHVALANFAFGNDLPFVLIAGPCQIESRDHAFDMAHGLKEICDELAISFVYKSSYDKANRTSLSGARGIGMDQGLRIMADIKAELGCPILTDVHLPDHCAPVAEVMDILQIPAFLCRQTDLLVAAARTGKVVNVKKGQFLSPWEMKNVADKLLQSGNDQILLTDRGTSFGYNALVSDMRGLPIMARQTGLPVIIDATHSVAQPGGQGSSSGGNREHAPIIARAAMAVGVSGVFMETHQDPDTAPSDGPNMIRLDKVKALLSVLKRLDAVAKQYPVELSL
jgi:2-dehydro-3-deoxyphosphooctonate aldolase (KDO 8-P synthase)